MSDYKKKKNELIDLKKKHCKLKREIITLWCLYSVLGVLASKHIKYININSETADLNIYMH